MAKAELQAAFESYHQQVTIARELEANGQYELAISRAMEAWNHVEDMIRYARRWMKQEFKSLQCVELVLRLAPPLLHQRALERLASVLKERKSIDRMTSEDIAGLVAEAVERMHANYRVLDLAEREPGVLQSDLDDQLGGKQAAWRAIAERLEAFGVISRVPEKGTYRLYIAFGIDRLAVAKCVSCGMESHERFESLLSRPPCSGCDMSDTFVISSFERST